MKTSEAVREIMKEKNITVGAMARAISDMRGADENGNKIEVLPRLITDRLAQKNISVSNLVEMLKTLDYKIVLVPRNKGEKEGEYEIE